jgi:hypothetical protein
MITIYIPKWYAYFLMIMLILSFVLSVARIYLAHKELKLNKLIAKLRLLKDDN